jgi:hypothetical protein
MKFLKSNPPGKQFVPFCFISKEADALTVFFEGDPEYSKRLNDHVTLFLSLDTDEIVGCRIKGITDILQDLPNYIHVEHNGTPLSLVFWSFRGGAQDRKTRDAMNLLAREAQERQLKLEPIGAGG